MKLIHFIACCFLVCLFACTSTKNITYLQDEKSDNLKPDELLKSIRLQEDAYKLQPADRLGLKVFSLTDEKINFLKDPELELTIDSKGQVEIPVVGGVVIS